MHTDLKNLVPNTAATQASVLIGVHQWLEKLSSTPLDCLLHSNNLTLMNSAPSFSSSSVAKCTFLGLVFLWFGACSGTVSICAAETPVGHNFSLEQALEQRPMRGSLTLPYTVDAFGELVVWEAGEVPLVALDKGRQAREVLWDEANAPDATSIRQTAFGFNHGYHLFYDGTLEHFGDPAFGTTVRLPAPVRQIACGDGHNIALLEDGRVVTWGRFARDLHRVPEGVKAATITAVAAGARHNLALSHDGRVLAWGANDQGQCAVPENLADVVLIAGGKTHSVAVQRDGTIHYWGKLPDGLAALPEAIEPPWPAEAWKSAARAEMEATNTDVAPAAPRRATILSNGSSTSTDSPTPRSDELFPLNLSATNGTIFKDPDKELYAAGERVLLTAVPDDPNVFREWTGDLDELDDPFSDVLEITMDRARSFTATFGEPDAVGWGSNDVRQTAIPSQQVALIDIASGIDHNLAILRGLDQVGWGRNHWKQSEIPAYIGDVLQVEVGYDSSLALLANGRVAKWGSSNEVPPGLRDVIAIASGADHDLALLADGTVVAWGDNAFGQTDVPEGLSNVVSISAGAAHSVALRADGTVVAWGAQNPEDCDFFGDCIDYGQADVPADLSDVVFIVAGWHHNLALRANDELVAWGRNDYGQIIIPRPERALLESDSGEPQKRAGLTRRPLTARAGFNHSMIRYDDGSVDAFGSNESGKSTLPVTVARGGVSRIAAGQRHSTALRRPGLPPNGARLSPSWFDARETLQTRVTLTARANGTGRLSYRWFRNDTLIPGATAARYAIDIASETGNGNVRFYCEISNTHGRTETDPMTFIAPEPPAPPPIYTLTVEVSPAEAATPEGGGTYEDGEYASIFAEPKPGYRFLRWSGAVNTRRPSTSLQMNENKTVRAYFEALPDLKPVLTADLQDQQISSGSDAVLSVAVNGENLRFYWYRWNRLIGATFANSFTVRQPSISASYKVRVVNSSGSIASRAAIVEVASEPVQHTLTLISNPPAAGTLIGAGTYDEGETVNILAEPRPGYRFEQWEGALSDQEPDPDSDLDPYSRDERNPLSVNITRDKLITANFTLIDDLSLNLPDLPGRLEVNPPADTYTYGATVTLTARPAPGFRLESWEGADGATENPLTLTMYADRTVAPRFVQTHVVLQTHELLRDGPQEHIRLRFHAETGAAYRLEASDDLETWTTLVPETTASSEIAEFLLAAPEAPFLRIARDNP